jgi:hypothetical protein
VSVGKILKVAHTLIIPAFFDAKRAGIQAFPQPIDVKAKTTGPRPSPGLRVRGFFSISLKLLSFSSAY